MGNFLKFAIGVAVLGFVGLVGLGVMSIIAARVFAHAEGPRVAPFLFVEQSVVHSPTPPDPVRTRPLQIEVSAGPTYFEIAGLFASLVLLAALVGVVAIATRLRRRGVTTPSSDETALVHELARRAQDLSQRMEALETILLDRTRVAR